MLLSSTKFEYILIADVVCEIWLKRFLSNLQHNEQDPIIIHCDDMYVIVMIKNLVFHSMTKHI